MPFSYPATEVFDKKGKSRVVFSEQEFEAALQDGWLQDNPKAESK